MLRPNTLGLLPPRTLDMQDSSSTAMVVVFTPPAVDPGEPPTNMRKIVSSFEALPMPLTDTELNPAVRAVAEANRDSISRSPAV